MLAINQWGLVEMDTTEARQTDGGFIPLVILGVTYTAGQVAAAAGAAFIAGLAIGASAAAAK